MGFSKTWWMEMSDDTKTAENGEPVIAPWAEGEAPAHWKPLVEDIVRTRRDALETAWRDADKEKTADDLAARFEPELAAAARDLLLRLYPGAPLSSS